VNCHWWESPAGLSGRAGGLGPHSSERPHPGPPAADGPKANEVPAVRTLLAQPPLLGSKVTLDGGLGIPRPPPRFIRRRAAIWCSSKPISPLAGGRANLGRHRVPVRHPAQCRESPWSARRATRHLLLFGRPPAFPQWQDSGLRTVLRADRTTEQLTPAKRSQGWSII
jgi:hypothetical protein